MFRRVYWTNIGNQISNCRRGADIDVASMLSLCDAFQTQQPSTKKMAEGDVNEDLLDYEEEEQAEVVAAGDAAAKENGVKAKKEGVKGNYVSIHSSGFRDFLLKPEILRAIVDCGFEHPSEVQHECIPQVRNSN